MLGLLTSEGEKFERYFAVIQAEAARQGCVFFAEAGDGREFETPLMEGEDMMGWLIPLSLVAEFAPVWEASAVDDKWVDYFKWAIWTKNNGQITVAFEE